LIRLKMLDRLQCSKELSKQLEWTFLKTKTIIEKVF
jgi:hypothetical protein